jgi:hypothetical protein
LKEMEDQELSGRLLLLKASVCVNLYLVFTLEISLI